MERRIEILPGVTLTAVQTEKFKTGCFSINFLRPLRREEAAANALIPSVLLRGSERCPDLRSIAARLDELYGASAGTLVRKKGEVQMTGFYADFIEDALAGEPVFAPMLDFIGELLLRPRLEDGCFVRDYVESEKRNLANAIVSRVNDKRTYATSRLIRIMCAGEAYAVPRLGELEDVEAITPEIEALAGGKGSALGTGGMATKLSAAKVATSAGTDMIIANGEDFHIIHKLLQGRDYGTLFLGKKDHTFSLEEYLHTINN